MKKFILFTLFLVSNNVLAAGTDKDAEPLPRAGIKRVSSQTTPSAKRQAKDPEILLLRRNLGEDFKQSEIPESALDSMRRIEPLERREMCVSYACQFLKERWISIDNLGRLLGIYPRLSIEFWKPLETRVRNLYDDKTTNNDLLNYMEAFSMTAPQDWDALILEANKIFFRNWSFSEVSVEM